MATITWKWLIRATSGESPLQETHDSLDGVRAYVAAEGRGKSWLVWEQVNQANTPGQPIRGTEASVLLSDEAQGHGSLWSMYSPRSA